MGFLGFVRRFLTLSHVTRKTFNLGAVVVFGAVVYSEVNGSGIISYYTKRKDTRKLVSPNKDGTQVATVSRHILLIRHGQYFHQLPFDEERFLTPMGQSQAELTGQRLKDMGFQYSVLYSSPMTRARETAQIIHKYLPDIEHIVDDSLAEVDVPPVASWKKELKKFFDDGEVIENAFRKHFKRAGIHQKEDTFEIIVCHANVIRYFINRTFLIPNEAWRGLTVPNCSITHIVVPPTGKIMVESTAIRSHLPRDKITLY